MIAKKKVSGFAAVPGSKVYHKVKRLSSSVYFESVCGVEVYLEELRISRPRNRTLCGRCASAKIRTVFIVVDALLLRNEFLSRLRR